MRNKAINALIEMGLPAGNRGFDYIVAAMVLFEDPAWRNTKQMAIYCKIASIFDTEPHRVERAMRTAFGAVYKPGNEKMIEKYLSSQNRKTKNLLKVLYLRLTQEE